MGTAKKRVPELRFEGFEQQWEQAKVSDLFDYIMTNSFSREKLRDCGKIRNIHYGDIHMYFGSILNVENAIIPFVDKKSEKSVNDKFLCKSSDLIIADASEDVNDIGKSTELIITDNKKVIAGLHTIVCRAKSNKFFLGFKGYLFNTNFVRNQMKKLANGAKVLGLSKSSLSDIVFYYPEKKEQELIFELFKQLDEVIHLLGEELNKYKNLKKAYLAKMFPKEGEKVPELRFPGFSGEWKEKKLGDIGEFKNGMNFGKSAMGHGYPFVNLQDVFGKTVVTGTELGLAESTQTQRLDYNLKKGDVLFIRSSVKPEGVGETALVIKDILDTTFSGFIIRFRALIDMCDDFKRFIFSVSSVRRQIMEHATSSANTNINQGSLAKIIIPFPLLEEQNLIGNFFKEMDETIELKAQELEKYKDLKKAYLAKMFV